MSSEREPFWLLGHRVGSTVPGLMRACFQEASLSGLLEQQDDGWHLLARDEASANTALHQLAQCLQQMQACGRWRDELLPVRNAEGQRLACIERAAVRALGIHTQAVHLLGWSEDGGAWLQKRSLDKADDPGLWDTLVGGMVPDGESLQLALARETFEEAGLDLNKLKMRPEQGHIEIHQTELTGRVQGLRRESLHWFSATLTQTMTPINQDGEVMEFRLLSIAELKDWMQAGQLTRDACAIYDQALS
jgi:8-oxo-dGTP pyrophosphatase MutT (NUDIX family)